MGYENLKQEYERIFDEKVSPFITEKIKKDYRSLPVFHLLDELKINRFRSGLPIIIAREYGVNDNVVLPLSAFAELTFTTAMAQDDFYDDDGSREGVIASHKKFGVDRTLLSCDYVNHKIIHVLNNSLKDSVDDSKRNKIIEIINEGLMLGYLSVIMEINSKENLFSINEDYIREIYLNKTIHGRMLLEYSFLMAGETEEKIDIIKKYGEHLAIAGQLKNDIYDFTKHKKYRGLSDLKQGHITWPLFILINSLEEDEKEKFLENIKEKRYDALIKLLKDKKIIEKTLELIDFNVEEAKKIVTGKFSEKLDGLLKLWAEGNRSFSKKPEL